MKSNRVAATIAITLTAVLALAGCAATTGGGAHDMPGMGSASSELPDDVNNADIMFTTMMIPHHEQAIEMADVVLDEDGIDPGVVALAETIKAAQGPEIELMESWLDEWGTRAMGDMGGMGDGMMSDTDMQALEDATGDEASRLFLEQMIEHHEGAIDMAQTEVDNGENPDVISLAESIIQSQTAEIATMQDRELLGIRRRRLDADAHLRLPVGGALDRAALNSMFGWAWADSVAALVIAAFAVKERLAAWRGDACRCRSPR